MRTTVAAAISVILASTISMADAQERLQLESGFSQLLNIPGTITDVVIGTPEIADVLPLTSNSFLLNARTVGTTNIVAFNNEGTQVYYARLTVRPVDIWPSFAVHVTPGIGNPRTYTCAPENGCRPAAIGLASVCMSPNDIAADGSRCGDRSSSARPGGVDGNGQPEARPQVQPQAQPAPQPEAQNQAQPGDPQS